MVLSHLKQENTTRLSGARDDMIEERNFYLLKKTCKYTTGMFKAHPNSLLYLRTELLKEDDRHALRKPLWHHKGKLRENTR